MKKEINELQEELEKLVKIKEDIQKKQLMAYSNNMSQQLFSQLSARLEMVNSEIEMKKALKEEKEKQLKGDDDIDGLIIG